MATDQLSCSRPTAVGGASGPIVLKSGPAATRVVLHVGCGPASNDTLHQRFRGPEWREIRVDLDPDVKPDIVASITDLRQIADGFADAVWSAHNLEHLDAHEVPLALSEFLRVLKPGGVVLITLPDLQQVAEFIVADKLEDVAYDSGAGPITPLDCVYGLGRAIASGQKLMAHRTGFTERTLRKHLERTGFRNVRISFSPFALWGEALKAG
jgi:SAM-dependent methyltransferase